MRAIWITAILVASTQVCSVAAQQSPENTLCFVIPFSPVGALDITARSVAPRMREHSGYMIVVENHLGANGDFVAELVAR